MPGRFVIIAALLFLCTGVAAHPPEAEFADWFRSLKELGTEGMAGSGVSPKQPFERLGCQEPRLARSARRRVGQLNLAPSGVSGRACAYTARCALIRSASCGVKCQRAIFRSYRLCRFIQGNSAEVPK
jgi:hypothetical protein